MAVKRALPIQEKKKEGDDVSFGANAGEMAPMPGGGMRFGALVPSPFSAQEQLVSLVVVPSAEDTAAMSNVLLLDDEENDTLVSIPIVPRTKFVPLAAGDFVHYSTNGGSSNSQPRLGHVQHLFVSKADRHQVVRMRLHKCWFFDEVPRETKGLEHIRPGSDSLVLTDLVEDVPVQQVRCVQRWANLCDTIAFVFKSATRTISPMSAPQQQQQREPLSRALVVERLFAAELRKGHEDLGNLQRHIDEFNDLLCAQPRRRWNTALGEWLWNTRIHVFLTDFGNQTNRVNVARVMEQLVTLPGHVPRDGALLVGLSIETGVVKEGPTADKQCCGLCGKKTLQVLSHQVLCGQPAQVAMEGAIVDDRPARERLLVHTLCFEQLLLGYRLVQGVVEWSKQLQHVLAAPDTIAASTEQHKILPVLYKQFRDLDLSADKCLTRRKATGN